MFILRRHTLKSTHILIVYGLTNVCNMHALMIIIRGKKRFNMSSYPLVFKKKEKLAISVSAHV